MPEKRAVQGKIAMISRALLGLVAGIVAVPLVHQPILAALIGAKMLPASSVVYNMAPLGNAPAGLTKAMMAIGFKGWPVLFNLMFWGGVWGAFYGLALSRLAMATWTRGLLLGMLVVIAGGWLLVPFFKGGAYFAGFDTTRMLVSSLINVPFGIATALLYGLLQRRA